MISQFNNINCFISHAWKDGGHTFAKKIANKLVANGINVWLDENEILGGEVIDEEMIKGVKHECDVFIYILTPSTIISDRCNIELEEALKQRELNGLQIIPVLYKSSKIPNSIKELLYIDFRDAKYFNKSINKLVDSIRALKIIRYNILLLQNGTNDERLSAAQLLGCKRLHTLIPIFRDCFISESIALIRHEIALALGNLDSRTGYDELIELKRIEKDAYVLLAIEDGLERCKSNKF